MTDADVFGYQREAWRKLNVADHAELKDMTHASNPSPERERR
jgi:hypothetical protein